MRGWAKATFAVLCLGALAALIGTSKSFEKCIRDRKNHQYYHALHEESPLLIHTVVRLVLHASCGRVTAGENDGAITALATVVVAFFTFTLWRSTTGMLQITEDQRADLVRSIAAAEKSAQAAEMSANAAIGLELPSLFLRHVRLSPEAEPDWKKLRWPKVAITFDNYGRTPAFITQYSVEVRIQRMLKKPLEYPHTVNLHSTFVLRQDRSHTILSEEYISLTENEIENLRDNKIVLWVYGDVYYLDFQKVGKWFYFRAHMEFPPAFGPFHREPDFVIDYQGTSDLRLGEES